MGETLVAGQGFTATEREDFDLWEGELAQESRTEVPPADPETLPADERCLTEFNHLLANRRPDGTYAPEVLEHNLQNRYTAVQEAALKYAITKTRHEATYVEENGRQKRTFMWLGKTALQVAESGYQFHHHQAAHERVDIEVDEALHNDEYIRPGFARILVSPKMTQADASQEVAKAEHLAGEDAIRVTFPETNDQKGVVARELQSLLVADVPAQAWYDMFNSSQNLWGRSFNVQGDSALPIMRLHSQIELPVELVPEGPLTILKAVAPFIADPIVRQKVQMHIGNFEAANQAELETLSSNVAERWQVFDMELVESVVAKQATPVVEKFIDSLQGEWTPADQQLFANSRDSKGALILSSAVLKRLSSAQQNVLFARAAIVTGNTDVLDQTDAKTAEIIRHNELQIQKMQRSGMDVYDVMMLDARNNGIIAQQNFTVGGGCLGENGNQFGDRTKGGNAETQAQNRAQAGGKVAQSTGSSGEDRSKWKWRRGTCRVETCATRPDKAMIGPCDVCKRCQRVFDNGGDPTKMNWITSIDTSKIQLVSSVLEIWRKESVDKHKQLAVN
ncbi:MAG TPA: hypothetical protein VJ843_05040 [Candidatus Saccharimonadales bacterium]|nr:hypothetical protein [Candidatus Saccharimonadales bacterium]